MDGLFLLTSFRPLAARHHRASRRWWFTAAVMLVSTALLVLYLRRVRQLTEAYNVRLEERWTERLNPAPGCHAILAMPAWARQAFRSDSVSR